MHCIVLDFEQQWFQIMNHDDDEPSSRDISVSGSVSNAIGLPMQCSDLDHLARADSEEQEEGS